MVASKVRHSNVFDRHLGCKGGVALEQGVRKRRVCASDGRVCVGEGRVCVS